MKIITAGLFTLMVIVQWFIPLRTVFLQDAVVAEGKTYRFKTQPIDPSDPFRGKYITLRFEADMLEIDTAMRWSMGETVYLTLEEDDEGFAKISDISRLPPENTGAFIRAETGYVFDEGQMRLEFPFSRFYVEESKASQAEQAYWGAASDTTQVAYAEVAVRSGNASLVDVKINGRSIVTIVEEMNE